MCRTPRDVVTGPASGEPAHGLGAQSLGYGPLADPRVPEIPAMAFSQGGFRSSPMAYHASGAAAAYLNSRYF